MRLLPFLLVLLVVMGGCVSTPKTGFTGEYELNWTGGTGNVSTFYLNQTQVKAVYTVNGVMEFVVLEEKVENLTIASPAGKEEKGYKAAVLPMKGEKYLKVSFKKPFTGFIAYTRHREGSFQHLSSRNETVKVVLPPGTTTGNRFLGTALPKPDAKTRDSRGRETLTWQNLSKNRAVTVKDYPENSPKYLLYTLTILLAFAVIIAFYYQRQVKRLEKIREKIEKL